MVVPLIAASVVPQIAGAMASAGVSKDNNLIDYAWQPMIKITKKMLKHNPNLLKEYPTGEMPNPRYPGPIRIQLPAWLFVVAAIAGVSVAAILTYGMSGIETKIFGDKKGGSVTNPLDILAGVTNQVQAKA